MWRLGGLEVFSLGFRSPQDRTHDGISPNVLPTFATVKNLCEKNRGALVGILQSSQNEMP